MAMTSSSSCMTTPTRDMPILPAEQVRRPAARSIDSSMRVVVVFPLVPVMTSHGAGDSIGRSRQASSSSPHTGTPRANACSMVACDGGSPGDTTRRSHSGSSAVKPSRTSTPITSRISARSRIAGVSLASMRTTCAPSWASASAHANPATPMPATTARTFDQSEARLSESIMRVPTRRRTP